MKKIFLTTGIPFSLVYFTGFRGVEKIPEPMETKVFVEKKEILDKNIGFPIKR